MTPQEPIAPQKVDNKRAGLKPARLIALTVTIVLALLVVLLARPIFHLASVAADDVNELKATPPGFADDASRLNKTNVSEIWSPPEDQTDPERQIAALLARAELQGLPVSIAGARHTMGGHTISPNGIVLNMLSFNQMTINDAKTILTVQSGALWRDVILFLEKHGRSVWVMQSDNSFSVGGSISANCHGWQCNQPPIASTVRSFRLLTADGLVRTCSRTENAELFSLVLGGYGLFGVILELDLRVVENERYRAERHVVPTTQLAQLLEKTIIAKPEVQMAYGRMNVAAEGFLAEAIVTTYSSEPGEVPKLTKPGMTGLRRTVFRGSADSDYGKRLRWKAETQLNPLISDASTSRNQLFNEGVEIFQNRKAASTDVLHEYFIPPNQLLAFVNAMQDLIPKSKANLLNVTIRLVEEDPDSFLRYADQRMVALVMLFSQARTESAESDMRALTEQLIDAALAHDGRYYLPYRLHGTPKQFFRAYPQAQTFFQRKKFYDPNTRFQNLFYQKYADAPATPLED